MSKENFIENFELYVKLKIQEDFAKNKYIDFALDFDTLLENYFSSFIENEYYIKILAQETKEELFANYYYLVSTLEKFCSNYHNISYKFENLINELHEQDLFNTVILDLICKKVDCCKKLTTSCANAALLPFYITNI